MNEKKLRVIVTSSVAMSAAQLAKIKKAVETKYPDQTVSIEEKIDPSIIGGVTLQVGSIEYNASLQNKLQSLRHQLKESVKL